jgi:hypothetical protein
MVSAVEVTAVHTGEPKENGKNREKFRTLENQRVRHLPQARHYCSDGQKVLRTVFGVFLNHCRF